MCPGVFRPGGAPCSVLTVEFVSFLPPARNTASLVVQTRAQFGSAVNVGFGTNSANRTGSTIGSTKLTKSAAHITATICGPTVKRRDPRGDAHELELKRNTHIGDSS